MIDAKIKEAWQIAQELNPRQDLLSFFNILANAYVEAEWQRRKAVFEVQCFTYNADRGNPRHDWTDADWRAEVETELRA